MQHLVCSAQLIWNHAIKVDNLFSVHCRNVKPIFIPTVTPITTRIHSKEYQQKTKGCSWMKSLVIFQSTLQATRVTGSNHIQTAVTVPVTGVNGTHLCYSSLTVYNEIKMQTNCAQLSHSTDTHMALHM